MKSRRRAVLGVLAAAVFVAALAGATTAVFGSDSEKPKFPPTAPAPVALKPGEVVLATGTDVAGPWQLRASKSEQILADGEEVQPAGLRCISLILLDPPPGTPRAGGGACGEGLGTLELPVTDDAGNVHVLLYGRAPESAAGVELSSGDATTERADTFDGPADVAGNVWVLAVPPDVKDPQLALVSSSGERTRTDFDSTMLLDRGRRLAASIAKANDAK